MTRIVACLCLAAGLHAQTVPWSSYGHDPQHTGLSTIGAQRLETIKWSTPVDLVLAGSSANLYIHYGSPLVTAANTVLVPVRTSSSNTYRVEAHSGSNGALLYTLPTDYTPPPHNWIPSYAPVLSQGTRVYYPGAGGTVYYRDQPDSASGATGQIAFYGNAVYANNSAAMAATVMISTPITADAAGNIYFGFDVTGANPANLTSGLARIGADGAGSWISASTAAQGDASIVEVAMNCAPAVSNDGSTLYFGVSEGNSTGGYLVSVNSTTLAPVGRVRLKDPSTGQDAMLLDDSSASPTVGPDGDVYYGVLESTCCLNDDRGWLLHFDRTLTQTKTPGAFGWDTTASVVPANLVPSYQGGSSYLVFTKYNNYIGVGPGGNGQNKIAVLDPNSTETDPITGATVMLEVITILGPTPNAAGGVREWCINSGAIDPFANSVIANSEDGVVYRWDFPSNSFIQQVRLTSGVGEAYTPTAIGADGTAYAINDAYLFGVGQGASLSVTSTHASNFTPGQNGAQYTLTVTNAGSAATSGAAVVTDTLPGSLTPVSIAGSGWSCTQPAGPCTRSDPLAAGASYPAITLIVNVAANAPSPVTNTATVSSDGATNSINSTSNDVTFIGNLGPASLSISKTHSGIFSQGQTNATYTLTVTDAANAAPASGTVTVTEMPPAGLTVLSMAGTGWGCGATTCTRGDSLAAGASYPPITVTVSVADNASSPQVNMASVAGGGSGPATATDPTVIAPVYTEVTVDTNPTGLQFTVDGGPPQTAPVILDLSMGTHTLSAITLQSGTAGTIYLFTGWSDGGAASHTITVGSSPATYTASFNTQYSLTSVASPVAGGSVNPPSGGFYNPGTVVQVVALPNTGYAFSGWSGPVANPSVASTSVTMSAAESITAFFSKVTGISITSCSASALTASVGQTSTTPASISCTVSDTLNGVAINGLTVSGLPTWLSASLVATSLPAGGSTTLTLTPINVAAQNPGTLGPPTIVVSGTPTNQNTPVSGSLTSITLTIFPGFSLTPSTVIFDVPTQAAVASQAVSLTDNPVTAETITATPSVATPAGGNWLAATGGTTPLNSVITVTSAGLPAGAYSGAVVYTSGNAPGIPNLPVTLNVGQLAVSGGPITFSHVLGLTTPGTETLNVSAGPAAITWGSSMSGDCLWLTDNAPSGTTPRGGASPVPISYTAGGAATAGVGTHVCILSFSAAASYGSTAPLLTTTVTLTVYPMFSLTPTSLTFDIPTQASPQSQTVSVIDSPVSPEPVTASGTTTWLSANGGSTPFTSTVTVTPSGAVASTAGQYTGSVLYASGTIPGLPSLPVTVNVGQLAVGGGPITFTHFLGLTTPAPATLNVSAGPAAIAWGSSISGDCAWLTDSALSGITPRGGSSPVTIGYTVPGATAAGVGTHVCTLSFAAGAQYGSAAPAVTTTVTLAVLSSPAFSVTPSLQQTVTVNAGSTTPVSAEFQIGDTLAGSNQPPAIGITVTPSSQNPANLFATNLSVATTPSILTITANPYGLSVGTYSGYFVISSANSSGTPPVTVELSLVVEQTGCPFTATPSSTISLTNAVPSDGSTPVTVSGSFTVTPGAGCTNATTWTAASNASWLILTSGSSGFGGGAVTGSFNALSNPTTGCAGSADCSGPQPRTATITITPSVGLPLTIAVTQPGSSASLVDRQVTSLYQSIFGRDPDPAGYAFWTGPGSASLSQMADDFLTSPEAFDSDFAVMAAYQAANGGPPTYAQYAAAVSAFRLGTQTVPGLFTSLTSGNSGYTAATLYQNLLNRAPSQAEASACTPLATCFETLIGYPSTTTPVAAPNNEFQSTGTFANLTSATGDHTNTLYVTMLYFVILNRDPDPGGLTFWVGVANSGGAGLLFQGAAGYPTRLQILGPAPPEGFIGSQEFQSLFQ